ncbi:hypothetical protein B566_EDAN002388 [Ephemera danica]|nr:hypothetical protein B566_EDAN002388 [Ephemera danica]
MPRNVNTYCLESSRPFKPYLVERVAHELLEAALQDPTEGAPVTISGDLALNLATQLRERVLELDFLRYKFIVQIHITEKKNQGSDITSRFLWDAERDNFAYCRYETENIIGLATVFAVYFD